MAARHFVVKRVGDRYVTVPKDGSPSSDRVFFGGWGLLLTYLGLERRGLLRLAMVGVGACMTARGILGRERYEAMWRAWALKRAPDGERGRAPSYQNDFAGRAPQAPADRVDEASMESFPASDPPARMASQASA